ncbi:MAG: hypothetical protein HZY79_04880 [Rhodoblastus sp.]|nr:MAG: hypothetical protein HZY79_04880 [Rhodoblastus sp.]
MLSKSYDALAYALIDAQVDAVISRSLPPADVMERWRRSKATPNYWVRLVIGGELSDGRLAAGESAPASILLVNRPDEAAGYVEALRRLEALSARDHAIRHDRRALANCGVGSGKRVQLIGAGLVNLILAHRLQERGYAISCVDGGPDPRARQPWTAYGCSHGGDDARMFTLSEMDNYNDRSVSPTMNRLFKDDVSDLGWSIHGAGKLSADEQHWVREFENIPVWLADLLNEDIFAFNRESGAYWKEWIARDPELFGAAL